MSLIKVVNENYCSISSLRHELHYQLRTSQSTCYNQNEIFYTGYGVCLTGVESVIRDFQFVKDCFNKQGGNLFHHFIISLNYANNDLNKETNELRETNMRMTANLLSEYIYHKKRFQNVYFIHLDNKSNVHAHFIMNSINFENGKRIDRSQSFFNELLNFF